MIIWFQNKEQTTAAIFEEKSESKDAIAREACGYFLSNSVLMRMRTSAKMSTKNGQTGILHLAHDHCLFDDLKIRNTCVARHFHWTGGRFDVSQYFK